MWYNLQAFQRKAISWAISSVPCICSLSRCYQCQAVNGLPSACKVFVSSLLMGPKLCETVTAFLSAIAELQRCDGGEGAAIRSFCFLQASLHAHCHWDIPPPHTGEHSRDKPSSSCLELGAEMVVGKASLLTSGSTRFGIGSNHNAYRVGLFPCSFMLNLSDDLPSCSRRSENKS